MFGREETNDILKQISTKQFEILRELQNINDNVVMYLGGELNTREKVLKKKIEKAGFTRSQFEVVTELMDYTREKCSKKDRADDLEN
jgi:hypothetical protein